MCVRVVPQALVAGCAAAELGCVMQTHQTLRAAAAGERRQEAGGLALPALPLVIGHQLKHLLLRAQHPLQDEQVQTHSSSTYLTAGQERIYFSFNCVFVLFLLVLLLSLLNSTTDTFKMSYIYIYINF